MVAVVAVASVVGVRRLPLSRSMVIVVAAVVGVLKLIYNSQFSCFNTKQFKKGAD